MTYEEIVVPEVTRLDAEIGQLDQRRADLIISDARQRAGLAIRPEVRVRLNRLDRELVRVEERLQGAGRVPELPEPGLNAGAEPVAPRPTPEVAEGSALGL